MSDLLPTDLSAILEAVEKYMGGQFTEVLSFAIKERFWDGYQEALADK